MDKEKLVAREYYLKYVWQGSRDSGIKNWGIPVFVNQDFYIKKVKEVLDLLSLIPQAEPVCSVCKGTGQIIQEVSEYRTPNVEPCPNCQSPEPETPLKKIMGQIPENETLYVGEIYRGRKVASLKAIKRDDGWYWQLEFGSILLGEKGD